MDLYSKRKIMMFISMVMLLASQSMARESVSPFVVGGEPALIEQAPGLLSLRALRNGQWRHFCSAVHIGDGYALTAAHCLAADIRVYWATDPLLSNQFEFSEVVKVVAHPSYQKPLQQSYDLALLVLDTAAPTRTEITQATVGQWLQLFGWGATDPQAKAISNELQAATVALLPHSSCLSAYGYSSALDWGYETASMLCASDLLNGRDSCNGDSGGPLYTDTGELVALVSWGSSNCGSLGKPGVYSAVYPLKKWIQTEINLHRLSLSLSELQNDPKAGLAYFHIGSDQPITASDFIFTLENTQIVQPMEFLSCEPIGVRFQCQWQIHLSDLTWPLSEHQLSFEHQELEFYFPLMSNERLEHTIHQDALLAMTTLGTIHWQWDVLGNLSLGVEQNLSIDDFSELHVQSYKTVVFSINNDFRPRTVSLEVKYKQEDEFQPIDLCRDWAVRFGPDSQIEAIRWYKSNRSDNANFSDAAYVTDISFSDELGQDLDCKDPPRPTNWYDNLFAEMVHVSPKNPTRISGGSLNIGLLTIILCLLASRRRYVG